MHSPIEHRVWEDTENRQGFGLCVLPISALWIMTLCLSLATAQSHAQASGRAPNPADHLSRRASPLPPPAIEDVKGLPRVLLIGDHGWGQRSGSGSLGYTLVVRDLMKGKANVHRVAETGIHTGKGVASLDTWLGDNPWDVIHFNFGLHDLKRMGNGEAQVPLDRYEQNLRSIVTRLRQTGATLIWASTTPIPEGVSRRLPEDAVRYNTVARKVMVESGVILNDFYAATLPNLESWMLPGSVHFSSIGAHELGRRVAAAIESALEARTNN